MHHLLKYGFSSFPEWDFSAIPITTEKFLTVTAFTNKAEDVKRRKLVFIDSYQFLIASLADLAQKLDTFPIATAEFPANIVKGKGLFPFELTTSVEAFEEIVNLPPK